MTTFGVGDMTIEIAHDLGVLGEKLQYTSLYDTWENDGHGCLNLYIFGFAAPFRLPLNWVYACNLGDNWTFILELLHTFVNEQGDLYKPNCSQGALVNVAEKPVRGKYVFRPRAGKRSVCILEFYLLSTAFSYFREVLLEIWASRRTVAWWSSLS